MHHNMCCTLFISTHNFHWLYFAKLYIDAYKTLPILSFVIILRIVKF